MKLHLIKKQKIEDYVEKNTQSRSAFKIWLSIINQVDWNIPRDITSTFNSADLIGKDSDSVVFNIGGNKYRMIYKYHFGMNMVHLFIKWIGTHAEYTKLCNEGKQFNINDY